MAGAGLLLVALAIPAMAVHDAGFQLEGNQDAADLSTGAVAPLPTTLVPPYNGPVDWYDSTVANGGPNGIFKLDGTGAAVKNTPLPANFINADFIKDWSTKVKNGQTVFDTSDGTTYTVGSKDTLNISTGWSCVGANNVTDKGDITNAYATIQVVNGHRIVYFALEKTAVQGDNNVGFWFLQDPGVSCPPGGTGNGTKFTGNHQNGDIFVVSEFTNGGGISSIKAYKWTGVTATSTGSLDTNPADVVTGVDCLATGANDSICATTNRKEILPPWPHVSKTLGLTGNIPVASFFEGGVDLDNPAFGFTNQCFAKYLADTRSSQEPGATLYDYALGDLPTCGDVTIHKITTPANSGSDSFAYTTSGTGLSNFSLDTNPSTATSDTQVFTNVPPGAKTVDEGSTTGWTPTNLVCTKNGNAFTGGDTTNIATGLASWQMGFGDHIYCTYTNVKPLAKISITPSATNAVGVTHTFTVNVQQDTTGTGSSFGPVPDGLKPTVTLTNGNGASYENVVDNCATTGTVNGSCTVAFDSLSAGTVTGHAAASVTIGSVTLNVATDGTGSNSGDAVKTYVDAKISIAPSATNEVGVTHTFTVTVLQDKGDGAGFVAAPVGTKPAVTLTNGNGASYENKVDGCASTGTNASGQCTVAFDSLTAGTVTGSASVTFSVGGVSLTRATGDGAHGDSANAVKTYVDAYITIGPSATNGITETHTFTVTVKINAGDGNGFVNAPDGTKPTVSLTPAGGASVENEVNNCATAGTVSGSCTVSFDSPTAGTVTGHASITINVGGVDIARATGDGLSSDSADAVKTYVDGSLSWIKHDNNGNLLAGATFQVCRTADRFGTPITPVCVTVLDNAVPDADPVGGQFLLQHLVLGTYTIKETVPPGTYTLDPTVTTVTLTLADPNQASPYTWVDIPGGQGCTPGFWKNHTSVWSSSTQLVPTKLAAAIAALGPPYSGNGTTNSSFFSTIGLPGGPYQGFSPTLTLIDALNANGGQFNALLRHGTAALLSSVSVNYPYKTADILVGLHNAFLSGDYNQVTPGVFPDGILTDLTAANNLDESACPTS